MALADLRTIFTDAAMSPEFQEFAIDKGIQSISMFARIALTPQEVRERFVQPIIDKIGMKDDKLKATVIEASALSAWDAANLQRTTAAAALPFALPTPIPASALPASVVSPASTAVPTTLRPGVWKDQVAKNEAQWDPPRPFPSKLLLGAESVLARMLHESTATRFFTPVSLGEILKARAYSSNGLINPPATQRSDEQTLGWKRTWDTAELTTTVDKFEPKSAWAIIDGLEAIKWSYSWAGYGTDVVADALVSPFIRLVRQRPQELDAVKSLYEASAWELCMLMVWGSRQRSLT